MKIYGELLVDNGSGGPRKPPDTGKLLQMVAQRKTAAPQTQPPQTQPQNPPTSTITDAQRQAHAVPEPALADVMAGRTELAKGASGEAVRTMQEELRLAGYKVQANGQFTGQTEAELKRFQTDHGLPPSGHFDKATAEKLSLASTKFPAYDKLFADGKLNTTIAVGFDDKNAHKDEIDKIDAGLTGRGYTKLEPGKATPEQFRAAGIDPDKVNKDSTYYAKTFQYNGKPVQSVVELITPGPNAKANYAKAMANSEVVMYTGHARYGSGPDFDSINSPAGNFRIGQPYGGHVALNKGPTDLQQTKMTRDYQLMLFDGCTSTNYLGPLRSKPGKDASNLDLVLSTTELSWGTSAKDVLTTLDGLTGAKSINEIKAKLEADNLTPGKPSVWKIDGFINN
jgi:peptidoglycan hydrolase-like protein with peptidoglycan-binding domain